MRLLDIINQYYVSSCSVTPQYRTAKRQFRSALKKLFKGDTILMYSCPHFEFSGFIKRGNRYVYFATGDLRHKICNSILIRTAQSDTDYTGGQNHSVSYNWEDWGMFDSKLSEEVNHLFTYYVGRKV